MSIETIQLAIETNISRMVIYKYGKKFKSVKEFNDFSKTVAPKSIENISGVFRDHGYMALEMNEKFINDYLAEKLLFQFDAIDAINQDNDEMVYDSESDELVCIYDAFSTQGLMQELA